MSARVQLALVLVAVMALGGLLLIALARDGEDSGTASEPSSRYEGATLPAGFRAPDFSLRNQDGERVSMRSLRGRPVIVTFLYTTCEDSCPLQAQTIKGTLNELGREVPAIAVAVDPPRDTPERAKAFLAKQRMTGRMDFVLGSRPQLRRVWDGFKIQPQTETLEHQGRFVLIDKRGFQRIGFPLDQATPERLAHDLRLLERES